MSLLVEHQAQKSETLVWTQFDNSESNPDYVGPMQMLLNSFGIQSDLEPLVLIYLIVIQWKAQLHVTI